MAIIYGKKIHVEIEYLRLNFLCSLVLLPPRVPLFFLFPWIPLWVLLPPWVPLFFLFLWIPLWVLLPPWVPLFFLFPWVPLFFFFLSSMGSSLHLLSFFNLFRSSSSSFFFKFFFFFYRTRVPRGKKIFMSVIKTQGFEAWFLHLTQASKAWDVTLLNSF